MQRLLSKQEAADYCGLSLSGFQSWIDRGIMPPALKTATENTTRWDKKAIDQAIDRMSGLKPEAANNDSPLDDWLEKRRAS